MAPCWIGIELEFMVATLEGGKKPANQKDSRWPDCPNKQHGTDNGIYGNNLCQQAVCHALASSGLPTARMAEANALKDDPDSVEDHPHRIVNIGNGTRQYRMWNPDKAGTGGKEEQFNYWFVTHEASVTSDIEDGPIKPPAGYRWYAVEINSPIISSQEELNQKLPTLKRALSSIRNNVKVWLNSECGFHIHVSPANGDLSLVVARRLAAMVFLVETSLLLKLSHPSRRKSVYARAISTDSKISVGSATSSEADFAQGTELNVVKAFRTTKKRGMSSSEPRIFRAICAILAVPDMESLAERLRAPKKESSAAPDAGKCGLAISKFGTVEFRYPEATFDVDFLSFWVDLVRAMFTWAAAPEKIYRVKLCDLYALATDSIQLGWIHWLDALEVVEHADFCKKQVSRYSGDLKDLNKGGILPKIG
ncbi:hypothetical protein TOPH_02879 [Tolypocladium ophioglossoides CBS 100239]|uniref:Amidoligase enzyme n=1 Tax=Tolypocladium ophioglossoides (strain CBS 100239) TaxID=1163406 RepID=A0A0L0NEU7_TOLOC|nr:hypothetical protein TOPH_02879 [Tolypocladium ophioglossoides CBS 100239]